MAETTYSYDIAADFPGGKVNPGTLDGEIRASSIVTALARIETTDGTGADGVVTGGSLDITFKDALSAPDKATLDGNTTGPAGGLLAAHDNAPSVEDESIKTDDGRLLVELAPFRIDQKPTWVGQGDDFNTGARGAGVLFNLNQVGAGDPSRIIRFVDNVYISGGEFRATGAALNSRVTLDIIAPPTPAPTPNGGGTGNANLIPIPGGNLIASAPLGDGSHDVDLTSAANPNLLNRPKGRPATVTAAVPVPAIKIVVGPKGRAREEPDGFWHFNEMTGAITPAPIVDGKRTGEWNLLDFQTILLRRLGSYPLFGGVDGLVRTFATGAARMFLPHWRMDVLVHHVSLSTLDIAWALWLGREFTV